jgi:hypothetical protein
MSPGGNRPRQRRELSLSHQLGDNHRGILGSGIAKGSQETRFAESSLKKFCKEGAAFLCSCDSGKPVAFARAIDFR